MVNVNESKITNHSSAVAGDVAKMVVEMQPVLSVPWSLYDTSSKLVRVILTKFSFDLFDNSTRRLLSRLSAAFLEAIIQRITVAFVRITKGRFFSETEYIAITNEELGYSLGCTFGDILDDCANFNLALCSKHEALLALRYLNCLPYSELIIATEPVKDTNGYIYLPSVSKSDKSAIPKLLCHQVGSGDRLSPKTCWLFKRVKPRK